MASHECPYELMLTVGEGRHRREYGFRVHLEPRHAEEIQAWIGRSRGLELVEVVEDVPASEADVAAALADNRRKADA